MNCYRINMIKLLPEAGIPFPKSVIVSTDSDVNPRQAGFTSSKLWIKRGDVHAVHKEDVTLANTDEEELTLLKEFHQRDIKEAVLQEHLDGDTVKFYAVNETELFHWYYLTECITRNSTRASCGSSPAHRRRRFGSRSTAATRSSARTGA